MDSNQLIRQNRIWNLINDPNEKPKSIFDCKVMSILNNSNFIDPIISSKIYNVLEQILNSNINFEELLTIDQKTKLNEFIDNVQVKNLKYFSLPVKSKISKNFTTPKIQNTFEFQNETSFNTSLYNFENLMFDNNVKIQYNNGESFSAYLYKNILNYFNIDSIQESEYLQPDWRLDLAKLLKLFKFNNYLAKQMFYNNVVMYDNEKYDVSFVIKYDVESLNSKPIVDQRLDYNSLIKYYETFDPANTKNVPKEFRSIFKTFPFKNKYYINYKTGSITFIDYKKNYKLSTNLYISDICNIKNINHAISAVAENVSTKELMSYIIHSSVLKHQGLALIILKQKIGNIWKHKDLFEINLPFLNNIFGWCKLSCNNMQILLPLENPSTNFTNEYVKLIKYIEKCASSKLDVAFLCSPYLLPAYESSLVYKKLTTDLQKYIFITLMLQEFQSNEFFEYMHRLKPSFSQTQQLELLPFEHLLKKTPATIHLKPKYNNLIESGSEMFYCTPLTCMEKFEFTNDRLNALVNDEKIEMLDKEQCRYIALLLNFN